jgi:sensor histidine kinase YesM
MILHDALPASTPRPLSRVPVERAAATNSELWKIIWTAGGLCWLCTAIVGILWAWPLSGTTQGGEHYVNSSARLLHHCLLFLISAPAYRVAMGLGWPATAWRRVGVIVVNATLALVIIRLVPFILSFSSGILDEPWEKVRESLRSWEPMQATAMQWLSLLRFWLPAYLLGLVAVALVATSRRTHRHAVQLAELSAQLANARMATLSAQLHPHFLFNSLNSISGLVADSPAQAVEMIARLGDFLRIALESTKKPWTRVADEVVGVQAYLAVQRSRFRDRLQVNLSVEPDALATPIPALLLQPLVENAIEHGLYDPDQSLRVAVTISRQQDRLIVIVTNSVPQLREPLTPASFGEGLQNVSARLFAAYNAEGTILIGPDPVCGTRAELNLPVVAEDKIAALENTH